MFPRRHVSLISKRVSRTKKKTTFRATVCSEERPGRFHQDAIANSTRLPQVVSVVFGVAKMFIARATRSFALALDGGLAFADVQRQNRSRILVGV